MKQFNTLLVLLLIFTFTQLQAQVRYLDEVFSAVSVEPDITYGTNITVLQAPNFVSEDLKMDVYTPVGDVVTDRPVFIYLHTGSFLPQYFNGQVTGGKLDSTAVEICTQLAKKGYVAISATYRQGWNPLATGPEGQNIRTGTLLNAAYRGIQDFRTCIRFLRKTVAEDGNPYGIDPDKVGGWGQGTGSYITLGSAYLDRFEEVVLEKFIDTETLLPYVDTNLVGNVYATTEKPLCLPNHVGYSSEFDFCVNMGGALGDASWIEGPNAPNDEPPTIGFHVHTDPFAPFGNGPVIVPVTEDFVVNVSGNRTAVDTANVDGTNDVLDPINELVNELNTRVIAYSDIPFQFPDQEATTLATHNIYPFVTPGNRPESGPWEWWDKPTLDFIVTAINTALGTDLNSDDLHNDGLLTNPDMSAEKGKRYIDTTMMYTIPRACAAFGLTDCLEALGVTAVEEVLTDSEVGLQLAPNPASDVVFLQSNAENPMLEVRIFDVRGLMVKTDLNIRNHSFELNRGHLPAGMYLARIRFEKGIITKKIMFK